jgi:transcriptional regulator with XRE-family HTH domain
MTLGEKISKLRKNCNYTQEQLAEILGVSRQSISKWESGISYPETDKLIRMGKLFACSMDYLLNEDVTEKG